MKKLIVLMLLALPFTLLAGESAWFQGSYEEALATAKYTDKAVYLKFYADW